jgi:hypothetical protein
MSDVSMTGWRSTAMAGVIGVGMLAMGAASIYGASMGMGRYLDARAINDMGPATVQLMVRDTVGTVVGAESAYMSGLMGAYTQGSGPVSPEFRAFQDRFDRDGAASEYRRAGAQAQAETPLSEAQILDLARAVTDRHEGLRDLLQTASAELSMTGLDQETRRDISALLIMDTLLRNGSISLAPRIADRIGEMAREALQDPAVAERAGAVRAHVEAGLVGHLGRSPSVAAEASDLANMAPGMERLEIRSGMGQRHSLRLEPAGTYRNVAHVEVTDPFADGVRISMNDLPAP